MVFHAVQQDLEETTDEELASLVLKDQDYFFYLMKRYENKLLSYIKRISGVGTEDAQDLLQEVFIKVYRNINNFNRDLKFSSWIYGIARNHVISNFRKLKSRPHHVMWDNDDEFLKNISSDLNMEEDLNNAINREVIYSILDAMDYKYKEVLELKFMEERDYKEISDIIKKPMGTVATLINRAKKKFREEYDSRKVTL